jgi:hypothetical protein
MQMRTCVLKNRGSINFMLQIISTQLIDHEEKYIEKYFFIPIKRIHGRS